jgi:acetyltransferase-like isoleucine patch superfamily enzyme
MPGYKSGAVFLIMRVMSVFPSQTIRHGFLRTLGLRLAPRSIVYMGCEIRHPRGITIGTGTTIGHDCLLDGRGGLTIGNNVNLSSQAMIWTAQHDIQSADFCGVTAPVIIGDFAWICARAIVLPGTEIGAGAVVAAGSVVTKPVEPFSVVGGIPAKPVGTRRRDLNYELGLRGSIRFV